MTLRTCDECGESVYAAVWPLHECKEEKWIEHQVKLATEDFDPDLELVLLLVTPEGKFAEWLAHNR